MIPPDINVCLAISMAADVSTSVPRRRGRDKRPRGMLPDTSLNNKATLHRGFYRHKLRFLDNRVAADANGRLKNRQKR
jgi:hypothetical protein